MDEKKLISLVQTYDNIYNINHARYMETQWREHAWHAISRELNYPAIACKQKWQSLRESYRKAINRRKRGLKIKPLQYETEMQFVIPYLKERTPHDCTQSSSEEDEFDDVVDLLQYDRPARVYVPKKQNMDKQNVDNMANVGTVACNCNSTDGIIDDAPIPNKKRRMSYPDMSDPDILDPDMSVSSIVMDKLIIDQPKHIGLNHLPCFYLRTSVERYPLYTQAKLKNNKYHLVTDSELVEIEQATSSKNDNVNVVEDTKK